MEPLLSELDTNIFSDANHGHDKVIGQFIAGIFGVVGSTPIIWSSKQQTSTQTSTFGAEFTALKKAMEERITIRYHLCSMGVQVTKPAPIWVDNMGVVLNASKPGSTPNKKHIAFAYHFVIENVENAVVEIQKIDLADSYGNPFTKALDSRSCQYWLVNGPL